MRTWWIVVLVAGCHSHEPQGPGASQAVPICAGQTPSAVAAAAAREGTMEAQLAPSFLDRMPACSGHDATPAAELVQPGAGAVNAKGDCEWSSGVKCHFHLGAEFVDSSAPRPKVGELHCIFPSSEAKSPRVFGTHFTCKPGTSVSHDHDVHAGPACGDGLVQTLAAAMATCDPRCCDDGTLTTTTEERRQAGLLDVRPDFRMCAKTAELDCGMLAGLVGHTANAPRFGAPIDDGL